MLDSSSRMNQQEKETFIASMIYSVMIPDVQRTLIREKREFEILYKSLS